MTDPFEHSASPIELIGHIEATCERVTTPCGDGSMVWRLFGEGSRQLVLFHGGSGSWWHWIRCIEPLQSLGYRLLIADLPGLGDSDDAPPNYNPSIIGGVLADGVRELCSSTGPPHIAGFSFGGITGGHAAAQLGSFARSMTIIGSAGMGLTRPPMAELRRWRRLPTEEEQREAHRFNLKALMLAHDESIDDLALHIQHHNTLKARTISGDASRGDTLTPVLPNLKCPLAGIYGEFDATAQGFLDQRHAYFESVQPGSKVHIIDNSGHWVMYEAVDAFVCTLDQILAGVENNSR